MRLEQSFEVPVPVAQAWGVLLDVERIAPCMPGATLTGFDGSSFTGTVKVKLGPVNLTFKGTGRFTERDETGHRMSMVASGQDSRGGGGAQARVNAVLHPAQGGQATLVRVVTDLDISGKVAQFGRGVVADVSAKLIKQFADCLAETIAAGAPAVAAAPSAPAPVEAAPVEAAPVAAAPVVPAPVAPPTTVDAAPPPTPPAAAPLFVEPQPPVPAPEEEPSPSLSPAAETPAPAEPTAAGPPAPAPAAAAPTYTPPPATNTNPPEYHPLAMQEPPPGAPTEIAPPSGLPDWAQTEPTPKSESAYAYVPEPTQAPEAATPASEPAAPARPASREAEPIDLLALSGASSKLRKAAPVLIIVALALIGLIIWLIAR